jgi:N-acetylglucosaminyldiphosphoundecaprenol N-acetyl-beta-D-mannosaminyltransferase
MNVLEGAYFNSCDGGSIAAMASRLHKLELRAFTGPEIFAEYITQKEFRQVLLGNTEEMFEKVVKKVKQEIQEGTHLFHIPLPFCSVEDFDYAGIAREIERLDADIIWVSLGAPKQEYFMQRLLPHLKRGLMLGVGAAFAFYLGELKDYSFRIGEYRFNWIYRLFIEPKKQFARVKTIFRYYPVIYLKEKKRLRG